MSGDRKIPEKLLETTEAPKAEKADEESKETSGDT